METSYINERNVKNIQYQINLKKGSNPYFSTVKTNKNVITDYDTFPYPRYFRGEFASTAPIVAEREAGWRPRNEVCYQSESEQSASKKLQHDIASPRNFFQPPCSTVYPKYISGNDISFDNIKLNENCVITYR
jgi:hypothetical protein